MQTPRGTCEVQSTEKHLVHRANSATSTEEIPPQVKKEPPLNTAKNTLGLQLHICLVVGSQGENPASDGSSEW